MANGIDAEPLLESEAVDSHQKSSPQKSSLKESRRPIWVLILSTANLIFLIINLLFASQVWTCESASERLSPGLPPSPANEIVEYETRRFSNSNINEWAGPPRPELEDAWDNLMRGEAFRASREDVELSRGSADGCVTLENGGYLASLTVYHELHCIEWIKRSFARVESIEELQKKEHHLDHCLQLLREGALCHGDVTVGFFHWEESSSVPQSTLAEEHLCVKWEKIQDWLSARALTPNERAIGPDGHPRAGHNKYRFELSAFMPEVN